MEYVHHRVNQWPGSEAAERGSGTAILTAFECLYLFIHLFFYLLTNLSRAFFFAFAHSFFFSVNYLTDDSSLTLLAAHM